MYKLKQAVIRGSALLGAAGLLLGIGTSMLPALASADNLNPLTQRSLTLSSSSPGWSYTDGSGNATYAPPNSGANGQKTGNYYSFKPSTTGKVNALTFQYCTKSAGQCLAPGDNSPLTTSNSSTTDAAQTSDLEIATSTPTEISSANWTTIAASASQAPPADDSQGNFVVLIDNGSGLTYSPDWVMSASNQEEASGGTGQANMITLTNVDNSGAGVDFTFDKQVEVKFFGTNGNYITNPGSGAFFVKINDYVAPTNDTATPGTYVFTDPTDINPADHINSATGANQYVIDGGVTVANVMNQSIEIQTKVLETMDFSVGTVDPDTLTAGTSSELSTATGGTETAHGECDNILPGMNPADAPNLLHMGDPTAEYSLSTSNTYGAHSYWRLSSNSSAGATVYYSGTTLHDTEGDQIAPIGTTAAVPLRGTPQFGLAIDNDGSLNVGASTGYLVNHDNTQNTDGSNNSYDYGADNTSVNNGNLDPTNTNGVGGTSTGWDSAVSGLSAHNPQLYPLVAETAYANGGYSTGTETGADSSVFNPSITTGSFTYNNNLKFAFDPNANTAPAPIATESSQVVDCVTAKMRYIANIAATTPAGIYTTKINYIAAPQY